MERLADVMLEQTYRAVDPGHPGPIRATSLLRLQSAQLSHNLAADPSATTPARRADVARAHFCWIFRDATGCRRTGTCWPSWTWRASC
jgi:hypothetical protein